MRFIKPNTNIDFIGKKKVAFTVSLALIVITILSLTILGGPKSGIDFTGGTLIQVQFSGPAEAETVRSALAGIDMANASVQHYGESGGNEYLIRTLEPDTEINDHTQRLTETLMAATGLTVKIRMVEMVGPQVGEELREKASFALFYALLFITIYISGRFESKWLSSGVMVLALVLVVYMLSAFNVSVPVLIIAAMIAAIVLFWLLNLKYSMGAIVALLHDILITVGIFSLLGGEFTLSIVAALLTIVGYSLNDTIIVYDRIRENQKKQRKNPFHEIINGSINDTLSRTILTSGTTMVVLLALFIWGGDIIHDFALTMIIGVLVGTYSSIYVASPILLAWEKKQNNK
jgi:preprotein translocase subunit SecF